MGTFRDNSRYQGTYRYKNGDIYEGEWLNELKTGRGRLKLANGELYEGDFWEGMKQGTGMYRWGADTYWGQFAGDKREGLGVYEWGEGASYRGEWQADRMGGVGRLLKDGLEVVGLFHADQFVRALEEGELVQPHVLRFVYPEE